MTERIDRDRRRFLGTAAMTIAGAHLGVSGNVEANQRAPRELAAIGGAAEWLNSPRLLPSSLAGKVVLVDFWTYTCINWLRTLPYIRAWAQKYREALVVIGVHTPEFAFERDLDNVRRAVRQMRIDILLRSITITQSGVPSGISPGQPSTSLMRADAFASITSVRASTSGLSPPFNGCSPKRVSAAFVRVTLCRLMPKASKPQLIGTT